MKPRELRTTTGTLPTSNGRASRHRSFGRRFGLAIAAASLIPSAFFVATVARSQSPTSKMQSKQEAIPYWAFAVDPPTDAAAAQAGSVDNTLRRVPGSAAAFTVSQTQDLFNPPDWHADHHPAMPDIVARGRKPDVFACGYCHLPNGQGRPRIPAWRDSR